MWTPGRRQSSAPPPATARFHANTARHASAAHSWQSAAGPWTHSTPVSGRRPGQVRQPRGNRASTYSALAPVGHRSTVVPPLAVPANADTVRQLSPGIRSGPREVRGRSRPSRPPRAAGLNKAVIHVATALPLGPGLGAGPPQATDLSSRVAPPRLSRRRRAAQRQRQAAAATGPPPRPDAARPQGHACACRIEFPASPQPDPLWPPPACCRPSVADGHAKSAPFLCSSPPTQVDAGDSTTHHPVTHVAIACPLPVIGAQPCRTVSPTARARSTTRSPRGCRLPSDAPRRRPVTPSPRQSQELAPPRGHRSPGPCRQRRAAHTRPSTFRCRPPRSRPTEQKPTRALTDCRLPRLARIHPQHQDNSTPRCCHLNTIQISSPCHPRDGRDIAGKCSIHLLMWCTMSPQPRRLPCGTPYTP
jgi:hypothetical protein